MLAGFFIILVVSFIIIIVIMSFATVNSETESNNSIDPRIAFAAVTGLCSAIAGFLFNSAVKLHSEIRTSTAKFLEERYTSEDLSSAQSQCGSWLRKHGSFNQDKARDFIKSAREEKQSYKDMLTAIIMVGNFFERVAINIRHGEVTEDLLKDFYQHIIQRYFDGFGCIIAELRHPSTHAGASTHEPERAATFQRAEELAQRWGWAGEICKPKEPEKG